MTVLQKFSSLGNKKYMKYVLVNQIKQKSNKPGFQSNTLRQERKEFEFILGVYISCAKIAERTFTSFHAFYYPV